MVYVYSTASRGNLPPAAHILQLCLVQLLTLSVAVSQYPSQYLATRTFRDNIDELHSSFNPFVPCLVILDIFADSSCDLCICPAFCLVMLDDVRLWTLAGSRVDNRNDGTV